MTFSFDGFSLVVSSIISPVIAKILSEFPINPVAVVCGGLSIALRNTHGSHRYHSPVPLVMKAMKRIRERRENRKRRGFLAASAVMALRLAELADEKLSKYDQEG